MTSADVKANGDEPATMASVTTETGLQNRWKKLNGEYDIEVIDAPEWPIVDCTPISADYLPSPNFYPPDELAGTPGGYGCFNDYVFECMHEACNDPSRHFIDTTNTDPFKITNYLDEFKKQSPASAIIPDWLTKHFVYDPSIDHYNVAALNQPISNYIRVEDTNQLLWRQVRAVHESSLPTPTEKCSPW